MEQSFVAWAKMRAKRLPQIELGIGDDAALMRVSTDQEIVVTADTLMDQVHFDITKQPLSSIGQKAVNANLSDIAAMGAMPTALFLSLCLPREGGDEIAADLYEGVCLSAHSHHVAIGGGDTNCWDGPLVIHITVVGSVARGQAWRRDGVQAEDVIVVTGQLGGSILGKHLTFTPRIDLAERLQGTDTVHAAMDISDGLSVDLLRMCDASGCGAILDLESIPVSDAALEVSQTSDKSPVEHALGDGEDFELLLAVPPNQFEKFRSIVGEENCFVVGEFTSRTGLWYRDRGKIHQLTTSGYVHGR